MARFIGEGLEGLKPRRQEGRRKGVEMQLYFLIFLGFLIFWAGFGTCAMFQNCKRADHDADVESGLFEYRGKCRTCGCVVVRGRCVNGCAAS